MIKALITDWDGVVFDSFNAQLMAVKKSCFDLGVDFSVALSQALNKLGKGKSDFIDELDAYRFFMSRPVHYTKFYDELGLDYVKNERLIVNNYDFIMNTDIPRVIPEVVSVYERVKKRGVKVCVLSTNFRKLILDKLRPFNFGFDYLVCNDDLGVGEHKPSKAGILRTLDFFKLDKKDVLFVGDMIIDVETSRNARVPFLGVSWGFNSFDVLEASLKDCPNEGVVKGFKDFEAKINSLIS